jgi:uncharacterized protein (TIGR03085 family)
MAGDARPAPSEGPLDAVERQQLCDLFLELGPDAPTLCEGWSTFDLAAHLVIRERDPRSGFAILWPGRFGGFGDRLMERAKGKGYETLVGKLRRGPLPVPWKVPGLRTLLNFNEYFVHHEDVRRADDRGPRPDDERRDAGLWKTVPRIAPLAARRIKGVGLEAVAPGYGSVRLKRGEPVATLVGPPQELVLYLNGRRSAARVELGGDPGARAAVADARLGI